ncbi:MAG: C39 family peptidase, partial [Leptolinea sp.]
MLKSCLTRIILFIIGLFILALLFLLIYQLPPVYDRLSWRLDIGETYARNLFIPAGEMPSPVANSIPMPTNSPSPFPSSTPTTVENISNATIQPSSTPLPSPSPTALPTAVALPAPKWEKQDWNGCGPAALTMYLRFYGWEGTQYDISQEIKPAREDRNVNVEELAYYARNHAGWLGVEYRVGGTLDLLKKLLAAGYPVMLEETFIFESGYWPKDDLWGAHYQLITGYDDAQKVFIGQDSFHGPNTQVPYDTLAKNWLAFNRVYILLYPRAQEEVVKSILGSDWDADANRQHALDASLIESQQNPKEPFVWFNVGTNLVYFERY